MNNLQSPKKELISFKYAVIFGVLLLIGPTLFLLINHNKEISIIFSDLITPIVGFISVLCLIYAARRSRIYGNRIYSAWLLIAGALLLCVIGDTLWAYFELVRHVLPFPSIADIFFLLYYIFFIMGLFLLLRPLDRPEQIYNTVLDGMIVIVSATLIFWNTLLSVTIITQKESKWAFSLSLYYIIRDFVIFMILLNLTMRQVNKLGKNPLLLLAIAVLVQFISDIIISYQFFNGIFMSGNLTDIGWILCYILIGLAGILQGNNASVDTAKLALQMQSVKYKIFSFPVIWIALAISMLIWGYYNLSSSDFNIIQIKVLIFFLLLIIRRTISVNENWRFYLKVKNKKNI